MVGSFRILELVFKLVSKAGAWQNFFLECLYYVCYQGLLEKFPKFMAIQWGCQIGMQGPQFCTEPRHFCKLDVATSRIAFSDFNLNVLQVATSNSNN